jgi:hypothetical protein
LPDGSCIVIIIFIQNPSQVFELANPSDFGAIHIKLRRFSGFLTSLLGVCLLFGSELLAIRRIPVTSCVGHSRE